MNTRTVVSLAVLLCSTPAAAAEVAGPARFCFYAPIIDLLPGERATALDYGLHGGTFRWEGAFGSLEVLGRGWASRPQGRIIEQRRAHPVRFAQRRVGGRYEVAIWNGGNGTAYFRSEAPFTPRQLEAIRRVTLFEEGQAPSGCDSLTTFAVD